VDDLQMARGNIEGGYNLAVGEPEFLQKRLWFGPLLDFSTSFPYPTIEGHKLLLSELKLKYPKKHIVITNGAKQALSAAFYAYQQIDQIKGIVHDAPYWPSYPTLAKLSGLTFNTKATLSKEIVCVTSPNNPNGSQPKWWRECDIWDAVYASQLYGHCEIPSRHEVAIYSAAKLLGLSGLRIGWLVTSNKEIAKQAANYVEFTTSGVALPTQLYAGQCLAQMREACPYAALDKARADLLENGEIFKYYLGDRVVTYEGVPGDGTGMFAWFSVEDPYYFNEALDRVNIRLVSGPACGGSEKHYRMSMGLEPVKTDEALSKLRKELK
jgi:aspartate/methionine/tyrosine aminotransferase